MPIDECIETYVSLSERVRQKRLLDAKVKGTMQEPSDCNELELIMKDIVVRQGLKEDALLMETPAARCRVSVQDMNHSSARRG